MEKKTRNVRIPAKDKPSEVQTFLAKLLEESKWAPQSTDNLFDLLNACKEKPAPAGMKAQAVFKLFGYPDRKAEVHTKIAEMIISTVETLLPNMALFDMDRFDNCEFAIEKMRVDPNGCRTPEMLEATVAVMAFAMVCSTLGRRRGYTECSAKPDQYLFGEDVYRKHLLGAAFWKLIGVPCAAARSHGFRYMIPRSRTDANHYKMEWLLKQMVLTGALFGFIPKKDAVFMAADYCLVEWDWLFTDAIQAHQIYKVEKERCGRE